MHSRFNSTELSHFDPKAYHFFGLWKQNLFSACFWVSCWDKEVVEKLGIKSEESGVLVLTQGNFFLKNSEIENIRKQIYQKIDASDEAFFKRMVEVSNEYFSKAVAYGNTLKDKKMTAKDFEEYLAIARKINFLWMLGAEQFSEAAEKKLNEVAMAESFPIENLSALVPKFDTPLNKQHKEAVELKKEAGGRSLEEIKNDKALFAKFEDHAQRFAWIEMANFAGEPLTVERLYEQVIHAQDDTRNIEHENQQISPQLAFHALCMSYCGYIRQAGAEYFFMLSEKVLPHLKSIAQKYGFSYQEFLLLRDVEILEMLKGSAGTENLKTAVERRKSANYVLFAGIHNEVFFTEDVGDIDILKNEMLPRATVSDKVIKGQVGNKGKYRGPARIIMNTHDFSKMQTGDVLVSTMTTPDFVVLMHKAGAIVTDIGGMLCHAAIVSREINKPCIIGTQFATQILKDGDMVEVDADNGIVRIL